MNTGDARIDGLVEMLAAAEADLFLVTKGFQALAWLDQHANVATEGAMEGHPVCRPCTQFAAALFQGRQRPADLLHLRCREAQQRHNDVRLAHQVIQRRS